MQVNFVHSQNMQTGTTHVMQGTLKIGNAKTSKK